MLRIDKSAATVLAGDVRSTFEAVDVALLNGTRMFGTVMETARCSSLPPAQSQQIITSVAQGISSVVKGRGDMVKALQQMNAVKRNSNLETVDLGCDNPIKTFTEATLPSPRLVPTS